MSDSSSSSGQNWTSSASGIVGPVLSLVGGLIGNGANKRAEKRARNHEEYMWNRNNAYNSPAAQRKRMEEAGLNPALMYGSGTVQNTASTPRASDPIPQTGMASAIPEAWQAYLNYTMMDKQIQMMDANIAQKAQQVVTSQTDQRVKEFHLASTYPVSVADMIGRMDFRNNVNRRQDDANIRANELHPFSLQAAELGNEKTVQETQLLVERTYGQQLDNIAQKIRNSNLPEREALELEKLTQQIATEMVNQMYTSDKGSGQRIDNYIQRIEAAYAKAGASSAGLRLLGTAVQLLKSRK